MIIGPDAAGLAGITAVSAFVAAMATILGAVFLVLFFAKGGRWGLLNDIFSVVLMLATIPIVLFLASFTSGSTGTLVAGAIATVGIVGMGGASVAQGLLIARVRTYEQLLPWTLGFGAIVGAWYLLVAVTGFAAGMPSLMALLAAASGVSFIALGYGFLRGNERHPLSVGGGVVLLFASTAFLIWIGLSATAAAALSR